MAAPSTSSLISTDVPRVCLTAVDEALLTLLVKRLARALLLEANADIGKELAPARLDSAQPDTHS